MNLVLNSYGCSLTRRKGRFRIKTDDQEHFISPQKVSAITLSTACMLSTDAIQLAIEHEIPIVLIARDGSPVGRIWSASFGSISTIRRNQARFIEKS